jgi:hypothetical protein
MVYIPGFEFELSARQLYELEKIVFLLQASLVLPMNGDNNSYLLILLKIKSMLFNIL